MGITTVRRTPSTPSATPPAAAPAPRTPSSSGHVTTTGALDASRFEQGIATGGLPRRWNTTATFGPSSTGADHGATTRAVNAVLLGVTSVGALAGMAPATAHAQDIVVTTAPLDGSTVDTSLARAAADIESRRATMTATELAESRRELYSAYVDSITTPAPVTASTTTDTLTRGERRVERLMREVERRMEVTAYDMAHPGSYTPLEGRPGYKEISGEVLGELFGDAIQDIPIGELPGGARLAQLVRSLPNAGHLDAENMTFNELKDAVGDANKEALRQYFQPFLDKHKVKLAIGGFASITAVRAASPEAARVLDRITPRIEIYDRSWADGTRHLDASLRYRDARVLPDIDVTASATRRVGPVDLRATATGTVAFTGEQPVTGTLGAGARMTGDSGWVDLEGTIDHTRRSTVRLSGVLDVPDSQLVGRGSITGTFGEGVARGNAGGRVELETSLDKRLNLGRGVEGSVGVYGAVGVDTDGRNEDVRGGLMLRLRW